MISLAVTGNPTGAVVASSQSETYYDALGVSEGATIEEIKKAYYGLIRQFRPSDHPEIFQKFNEASRTLTDSRRRGEYDQHRRVGRRVQILMDQAAAALEYDTQKAVALLKNAIALAPDMPRPRYLLAQVLIKIEEYAAAEKQFQWLLKESPRDESLYLRIARCQYFQEDYAQARKTLAKAFALNPRYHDAWMLFSRIEEKSGDYERAVSILERAISNDGKENFADFDALIRLHALNFKYTDASLHEASLHRVLAVVPSDDPARSTRAIQFCIRYARELESEDFLEAALEILRISQRFAIGDVQKREESYALSQEIGRSLEAQEIAVDTQIPKALRDALLVRYARQLTPEQRRLFTESSQNAMKEAIAADARNMQRSMSYLRQKYPRLSEDHDELLESWGDEITTRIEGVYDAISAKISQKPILPPSETPELPEPHARKGLLGLFRRKS